MKFSEFALSNFLVKYKVSYDLLEIALLLSLIYMLC